MTDEQIVALLRELSEKHALLSRAYADRGKARAAENHRQDGYNCFAESEDFATHPEHID